MINIDLKGKTALVTGGARGIGAAVSRVLIQAGAGVAVHYGSSEESARNLVASHAMAKAFQADLSQPDQVSDMFGEVIAHFGQLDILVNNAGIAIHSSPGETDEKWLDDWNRTLRVNLTAPGFLCKLAIPHMVQRKEGVIINISSRAAHRGDTREYLAYAASKGGMEALTKSLARAYGKEGLMVYGVAPGFTRTDMAQDFIDTYGEDYALNDIALSELTTPEDIAPLIAFLASGMARHATGTTIDVNAASYVR